MLLDDGSAYSGSRGIDWGLMQYDNEAASLGAFHFIRPGVATCRCRMAAKIEGLDFAFPDGMAFK
jgi:hypothetical protein